MVSQWQLRTCLDSPATEFVCSKGESLTGVVVVVEPVTAFLEGGFAERSLMNLGR